MTDGAVTNSLASSSTPSYTYGQPTSPVFSKFEASVQIYVTVLNSGYKSQDSGGNVICFKINSYEISFLFKI